MSGVRCQVSGVRCQVSGARAGGSFGDSGLGVRGWQFHGVRGGKAGGKGKNPAVAGGVGSL